MSHCKYCRAKTELIDNRCRYCGIEDGIAYADLTTQEKKVRFHAQGIRIVAMFHLIGAGCGFILAPMYPGMWPMIILALVNVAIGFGLSHYALGAYRAATVYYFLIGMVNTVSIQRGPEHLAGLMLCLLALYLIGNGTSKAIFERRLPEPI